MSRAATSQVEHAPALDGLRAIAVLAVLAYHGGVHSVPGGYLGVDVFLVLSGYLITALLVAEWRRDRRIDVARFWERRVRRLLPALALVVGVVVVHAGVTGSPAQVRGEAVASLTWTQNWYLALRDSSYFALFSEASPLRHIWSLALEAQWYLVWPLVVALALRMTRGATLALAAGTLALAGASAALMAVWFDPGADPSRIYYGTDTRGHVLLIGAALALFLHRAPSGPVRPSRGWIVGAAGGVAVLAWAFANLADLEPRLYRGGFALVGLATAAVVAAALRAGSPIERLLSLPPLPALGRISYGVYLWHWPLYVWLGPSPFTTAAAIGLAVASYRVVELPVRAAPRAVRRPALVFSLAAAAAVVVGALAIPVTSSPEPAAAAVAGDADPELGRGDAAGTGLATIAPAPVPVGTASRIEMAGDSVAWTLAEDFNTGWGHGDVVVDYRASYLGCGVVAGQPYNDGRPVLWADPACEQWESRWQAALEEFRPDVLVVLLGAWEVLDRRTDEGFLEAGTDAYADYIREQLRRATALAARAGIPMILLTAPCNRPSGGAASREVSDRGSDERVAWFNEIVRSEAVNAEGDVTVADLHAVACPRGAYLAEVDGRPMRTDGVHFTADGARFIWDWLIPQITTK